MKWLTALREAIRWRHAPVTFLECPDCHGLVAGDDGVSLRAHRRWHIAQAHPVATHKVGEVRDA